MINRSCSTTCSNSDLTTETATMAWCSSRGGVSGQRLRFNINDFYSGLFQLRDTLSRTTLSGEDLPRFLMSGKLPLLLLQAIRCTLPTCRCECFAPGKQSLRYCGNCNHGWVAHALDKLGPNHAMNLGLHVEVVQPNIVFDIASLMLYGAHATPVRLKILLDRLFSVLQHEEVLQILHGFGWTYEDYARGYILQNSAGRVLDKWCVATQDEELVVLQQFLRFGETKAIAHEIILQDRHEVLSKQPATAESDIKKFIERSNLSSMQNYVKSYESTRQLFANTPVTFNQPVNRIMPLSLVSQKFIPSLEPRFPVSHVTPTLGPSLGTPPLNCPQVVQRFDVHTEQPSSAINLSIDCVERCNSTKCDSPQNLSTTSTVVSVTSPSHQALHLPLHQQLQDLDEVDGSDPYISGSEDDEEALDYSNKDNQDSPTDGSKKSKHVRKSTNPIKRQWTPSANFGNTFIGPNGKKRVLCTACNKTFCDKGALKIHYSAVHLKEMHKCTVEGCNMMFSSRRSRNRHSANPNPKLHMPQKRKDELDHAEEIDLSIMNGSFTSAASSTPTKSISTSPLVPSLLDSPHMMRPEPNFFFGTSSNFPFMAPSEKRLKLEIDLPTDMCKFVKPPLLNEDEPCDLSKKTDDEVKLEIDLDKCGDEKEDVIPCDGDINGNGMKTHSECGIKGGKRRKNTAPIRCAQTGIPSYDSTVNTSSSHVTPLNLSNGKVLNFSGERPWDASKSETIFPQESNRNTSNEYRDHVEHAGKLYDERLLCSQDSQEKRNGGHEMRNFPKMASFLWGKSAHTNTANVSEDELQDEQASDEDFAKDEDITKRVASCVGADDSDSEIPSSEDDESFQSSDVIQDYPADVYADKEYPLKCKLCGKTFQNNFTVKIHFQNVHLKVMHPCTVIGCTAAFPSKRSRNRHSANFNLHRRMHAIDVNSDTKGDDNLKRNNEAKVYSHELQPDGMDSNKAAATAGANEAKPAMNNNESMNRGHNQGSYYDMNNDKVSCSNPSAIAVQHSVNGHIRKSSLTRDEVIFGECERDTKINNEVECLVDNAFKVQSTAYDMKRSNSAELQDHTSVSHCQHIHSPSDPLVRKAVSPRRAYNRLSMA